MLTVERVYGRKFSSYCTFLENRGKGAELSAMMLFLDQMLHEIYIKSVKKGSRRISEETRFTRPSITYSLDCFNLVSDTEATERYIDCSDI